MSAPSPRKRPRRDKTPAAGRGPARARAARELTTRMLRSLYGDSYVNQLIASLSIPHTSSHSTRCDTGAGEGVGDE